MRPDRRLLPASTVLALVLTGMTACSGDRADAPGTLPGDSLSHPSAAATAGDRPSSATQPSVPAEPSPSQASVPTAYRGQWQRAGTSCATRDETRLRIEAQRVTFHESAGDVLAAGHDGDRLTLTLRISGEGQTREASYRFGLSNDGRWLTDLGSDLVRERCP